MEQARIDVRREARVDLRQLGPVSARGLVVRGVQAVVEEPVAVEERSKSRSDRDDPASPVDLNTAGKSELVQLPGVGDKTADAIIERRKHIPFRKSEDLMEVKGIGEKKFAKIKPFLIVR